MDNVKRIKKISKKRENKIAADVGGKRHSLSGGLWWKKGDASDEHFLIEDKFTERDYYSITQKVLNKIEKEAMSVSKLPVLRVGFLKDRKSEDYVVLRFKDCVFHEGPPVELGSLKSYRFTAEHAKDLYVSGNTIMLIFMIDSLPYVVMGWDEFVECKGRIILGGYI